MKYILLFAFLALFLVSCSFLQLDSSATLHSKLEKCIFNEKWSPNIYPEACFYESMEDETPEEVLDVCKSLKKEGEYDYRSPCFNVLIQKFKSEELLSEVLDICKDFAPECKNRAIGFYGNPEKCEVLKKDFNITVDGKTVFSFYDMCVGLTKQAEERKLIWEAIIQRDTELCQSLTSISKNICLFYIAEETNNKDICNQITVVSDADFTYQEYCSCKLKDPKEPKVICIDIGNIFNPNRNESCTVKRGEEVIAEATPKHSSIKKFRMKYAPCDTSWRYGDERNIYSESIFWSW